jgi:hypothetical protein
MSLVSLFPLMSHYNPKSLKMTDVKRLFTQQPLKIVASPICLYLLLLHRVNPNVQISPAHSPVKSSHTRKRIKAEAHHMHDKGKVVVAPSSPSSDSAKFVSSRMHLRDDFSHVISEIKPKGSTQPKSNSEKSKEDSSKKGKIASQSGKYGF